ncbi:6-phosphogluconolactonase [bacterium]|nr:6-phosphogluconolactonase [bacterium]
MIDNFKKIHVFEDNKWVSESSFYINAEILKILKQKKLCNVMIPGGKSFEKIFIELLKTYKIQNLNINLFMSDERCTKAESKDNNYNKIKLLSAKKNIKIYRIKTYLKNLNKEIDRYSKLINFKIDILILSVADDGHMASIFPERLGNYNNNLNIDKIQCSHHPFQRLTITTKFVSEINNKIILLNDPKKGKIIKKLLKIKDINTKNYLDLILLSKCLVTYKLFREIAY